MVTVAAAWCVRIPNHRYTDGLRINIEDFIEQAVTKKSYIENKVSMVSARRVPVSVFEEGEVRDVCQSVS
eukprot:6137004-Pyramimonas_sp.AAC.1